MFDAVPRVIMFKDGKFYSYDAGLDKLDYMLHFINRLINPLVKLENEEEILNFLGLN